MESIQFALGDTFSSWEEVLLKKKVYEETYHVQLWMRDSRTLEAGKKKAPNKAGRANASLKYFAVTFCCRSGGRKFKSSSSGLRRSKSARIDCPVKFSLTLSDDGQSLIVTQCIAEHTHETSEESYQHSPRQRRLNSAEKKLAIELLASKVNKKLVVQEIHKRFGKIVTVKDMKNLEASFNYDESSDDDVSDESMNYEKKTVSVKWWNHRGALCHAVKDMYMKSLYTDIKVKCEGKEHWAHKFVLSACSEFFEERLTEIPYDGTFALPLSIREKEFLLLLDFMYLGVVEVLPEDLPDLIGAAEQLMIRGLAVPFDDGESDLETHDNANENVFLPKKASVRDEVKNLVNKRKYSSSIEKGDFAEDTDSFSDEAEAVNSMLKVELVTIPKKTRKKTVKRAKPAWKVKVSEKEGNNGFSCSECNKLFQWPSNLRKHMRTHMREKPYNCNVCSYKSSYIENLKRHQRTHAGVKPNQYSSRSKKKAVSECKEPESIQVTNEPSPDSNYEENDLNIQQEKSNKKIALVVKEVSVVSGNNSQGRNHEKNIINIQKGRNNWEPIQAAIANQDCSIIANEKETS